MKITRKLGLCLIGLASLTGAVASAADTRLVLNVPFEFVAGGKRMPAGEYRIMTPDASGSVIVAGRGAGNAVVLLTTPGERLEADAPLGASFEKRGGEPHLSGFALDGWVKRMVKIKPSGSGVEALGGGH